MSRFTHAFHFPSQSTLGSLQQKLAVFRMHCEKCHRRTLAVSQCPKYSVKTSNIDSKREQDDLQVTVAHHRGSHRHHEASIW